MSLKSAADIGILKRIGQWSEDNSLTTNGSRIGIDLESTKSSRKISGRRDKSGTIRWENTEIFLTA